MKDRSFFSAKVKNILLYGGISKEEYDRVKQPVAQANHKSLLYWSVLVSFFWIYCLVMSMNAEDYTMCRPAYIVSLCLTVFSYLASRFVVARFPDTLNLFKFIFRLSILGGRDWHRGLPVEPALPHDVRRRHYFPFHLC